MILFYSLLLGKDTNKRARNMKFTSIFFTASASILEIYLKDVQFIAEPSNESVIFWALPFDYG